MAYPDELAPGMSVLERTPRTLTALLDGLPAELLHATDGPKTWSAYTVVGHLIHGERVNWIARAKIILEADGDRRFTPFDREAQFAEGTSRPIRELLATFAELRQANLTTVSGWSLTGTSLALEGIHPEFGPVTLRQLLSTWVAHDLGHLTQITRTLARHHREAVGPWRAYLSVMAPPAASDA